MVDVRGRRPVLVNDVLAAVNAATARTDGEEAAALQAAEEGTEDASETGTAVEVHTGRRGHRGRQASRRRRGTGPAGASHPRNTPRPLRLPDDFWTNVPPRYIPFNIWHNGQEVPAKYVTIQMTNNPYVLGTMGAGCPVFQQPAHVTPRITKEEVNARENTTLRTLGHDYQGRDWVNDALIQLRDDGLKVEVHRYCKLHEELDRKLEEVRIANDHIADIYLELAPCQLRLLQAEAGDHITRQRGEAVQLISPWTFEHRRSA